MEPEDFDSFEFIDYTTSGPWEKFIVQIEDCLKHWGLVHNSYGVFNPNVMPTTDGTGLNLDDELALALNEDRPNSDTAAHKDPITASTTTTATTTAGAAAQASQPAPATSTIEPAAGSYEHNATVTLENTSYVLSYRYHPAKARIAAGVERIDLDFLPISLEGLDHHILHRWTALTHILVLAPAANTDSHIIDLGSAKLLLSSFAIAFQNTGCNIPVFVPTGHPKNKTYTGLSIQPQLSHARDSELGLEETAEDQAIEVRLNTVVVPYPPAQYTNLSGILDLFIERMGLEDEFTDGGVIGAVAYSQEVKEQIHVSGLFSYQLDNWYDDKWRQWADTGAGVLQASTATDPLLPIGPIHDPLKSLQLVARFASAPSTVYLDSKNLTDMDASQANIWIIKALFKSEDYGLLSGILGDVISSWISGLSIASSVGSRSSEKEQRSYTSLLRKGARLIQGTISMVDAADVDNIAKTLLKTPASSTSQYTSAQLESTQPHIESCLKVHQVVSAAELGLRFRHASIVPQGSLLWKMLIHLVDVISPNSHISYPTSFMGFLKALWAVLLKQITALWEDRKMIPWIPVFLEPDVEEQANEISISNQQHNDKDQHTRTPVVDLRFNLLHQKLSMVNCCIVRDHTEREERAAMLRKSPVNDSSLFSTPSSSATFSESTGQAPAMLVQDSELGASTASASKDFGTIAPEETEGRSQSGQHVNDDEDAEGLNGAVKDSMKEDVPVLSKDGTSSKLESTPFKGLTLLETGAPLVVPRLQEPGCMTEDMIREQEELLENLGSTPDAAKTRAEMQSAQLISDMSAFKAANLGCVLGDFIRWHSPKDWDNERRQMSSRMADSGNFWQELWEKSEPLSALDQIPLFDHKAEAEKALAYLKSLSADEVFVQLLPSIGLIAYDRLASHAASQLSPTVTKAVQELGVELMGFPWSDVVSIVSRASTSSYAPAAATIGSRMEAVNDVDMVQAVNIDLKPLVGKFRATELTMGRFMALVHKFPEQYSLAERILKEEEAISVVEDGAERDCVYRLFKTGSVEATTITTTTAATTTAAPAPAATATKIATKSATGGAGVGAKAGAGSGSNVLHTERPFPKPSCREFVIETFDPSGPASSFGRGSVSMSMSMSGSSLGPIGSGGEGGTTPTWYARPLQRRMYACFKDSEVRIVEAIAKDGMFM